MSELNLPLASFNIYFPLFIAIPLESYYSRNQTLSGRASRDLENLIEKTKAYIRGAKTPATVLAYQSDFRDFTRFCREHNLSFLPSTPETVALYITDCASRLASGTITRRLTSITKAHHQQARRIRRHRRITSS